MKDIKNALYKFFRRRGIGKKRAKVMSQYHERLESMPKEYVPDIHFTASGEKEFWANLDKRNSTGAYGRDKTETTSTGGEVDWERPATRKH